MAVKNSNKARLRRHKRVRGKVSGTAQKPRLCVFRSATHIYAQIIDDVAQKTLVSASTVEKGFDVTGDKKAKAYAVGAAVAKKAAAAGITDVVFDRGGYLYHGRVAELAKGARESGLKF